jgi:sugar lactone lactonase YvrE
VNLGTGDVYVTPLSGSDSRAIFSGSAIGVSSSRVLNDEGELTRRAIEVTLTNNTTEPIGGSGLYRVVLSEFDNLGGLSTNYSADTVVSTPASVTRPYGVTTDSDGSVYFSGKTSSQIYKMVGGSTAQLATGFSGPAGLAVIPGTDKMVVAENSGHVISVTSITSGGRTVIAGTGAAGSADGPAGAATFSSPDGVAVDSAGNIYVSDAGTSRIRMISDPFGTPVVSTLVSSGLTTLADIDVMQIKGVEYLILAMKHSVTGVALPGGQVFSIAGTSGSSGNVNGPGNTARFKLVRGVHSLNGAIFVMDSQNYQVKQVTLDPAGNPMNTADWYVSLLAGDGTNAFLDGAGIAAQFQYSQHLAASPSGKLYAASYSGDDIRLVESTSSTLPFLGSGGSGATDPVQVANPTGYYEDSAQARPYFDYSEPIDASASQLLPHWDFLIPENVAAFEFVLTVESSTEFAGALDGVKNITAPFVGSPGVYVRTLAGSLGAGYADGPGASAAFFHVYDIAAADDGTLFMTETNGGQAIRMITTDNQVHTIIGHPSRSGPLTSGTGDAVGLTNPLGLTVNAEGTVIYFTDAGHHYVVRAALNSPNADKTLPQNWDVSVIAGTGVAGYVDGDGTVAQFDGPGDVVYSKLDHTLYVSDFTLNKIRRMTLNGSDPADPSHWQVTLLAGSSFLSGTAGDVDDNGTVARFDGPLYMAMGPNGKIYVAEIFNDQIRVVNSIGDVLTLAGDVSGAVDADTGVLSQFNDIRGIGIDDAGYIYVNDQDLIRRVHSLTGSTRTIAGGGITFGDTTGDLTMFNDRTGLAVLPNGEVVVGERYRVRQIHRIIDSAAR